MGSLPTSIKLVIMALLLVGSIALIKAVFSQPMNLDARIPNSCTSITGDKCVFPFTYKGVEYYQCTYADSPTPWCATQVDNAGIVVTNRWGDCDTGSLSSCQSEIISTPSCTTDAGECVFPFRYNGIVYTSCTTVDKDFPWCSTNTTLAGTHIPGFYGNCPSSCPGAETGTTTCDAAQSEENFISGRNNCACVDGQLECSTSCTPGELFSVDCNTCVCNDLGQPTCTTNECSTTSSTTTTSSPSSSCTTIGGPALGAQCVFPFTFAGTTYTSCAAWIYGGQPEGTTWCSTKVDETGNHVNNEGNYGFCGEGCTAPRDVILGEGFGEIFETNARSAVNFGKQRPS